MFLCARIYESPHLRRQSLMLAVNLTAIEVTSAVVGSGTGAGSMLEFTGERVHQLPKTFFVTLSHLQPNINLTVAARARWVAACPCKLSFCGVSKTGVSPPNTFSWPCTWFAVTLRTFTRWRDDTIDRRPSPARHRKEQKLKLWPTKTQTNQQHQHHGLCFSIA